jgi:hypothetical protein
MVLFENETNGATLYPIYIEPFDIIFLKERKQRAGGGCSLLLTRLWSEIPVNREKYREFIDFCTPSLAHILRYLPDSMGLSCTKTVACPKRNREYLVVNRESHPRVTGKLIFSFAVLNAPLKAAKAMSPLCDTLKNSTQFLE